MTKEEKLSKALHDFKTKYPSITSADLQTFIIGWQEAVNNCFIPDISNSEVFEHYGKPFTSGRDLWDFLTAHYNFTPKT